jgi:glucoamylase
VTAAPGAPGIEARWTSSAKTGVGAALGERSRIWFTVSHGIIDEIYHPRIDTACTRDLGLLLSADDGTFIEEKRDGRSTVEWFAAGVPGFVISNELPGGMRVTKVVFADPDRDVLVQRTRIEGASPKIRVTVLLAPHLSNRGGDNIGWVGGYKGVPMLFARGSGITLALAVNTDWVARSVGYVGFSDGWQDVKRHGRLLWSYDEAGPGNVALAGEVMVPATGEFDLVVGFGRTEAEAGNRARASLATNPTASRASFTSAWEAWHGALSPGASDPLELASRAVLRVHESISFPGATIASLSIPWGFAKGDDDMGGYHLVWPRDMVETLGGMLACGAHREAVRGLDYLRATQEADGHWAQNMWLDGTPYWQGVQMDETALPILGVGLCRQAGLELELARYWPMVEAAAGFIVANGPVTGQDRWEEDAGYSPFTVAAEVAALVVAAGIAEEMAEPATAEFLRDTADAWNESIERWMYVLGTDLAEQVGVEGYYVRIAPPDVADGASPASGWVPIKNRPPDKSRAPAAEVVSPDALALVRFGLRDANDPRIVNTIAVVDHTLRVELGGHPAWRRYSEDGYGEHLDGSPFDGTGVGRPWPLLTGERGHYELAAGNHEAAAAMAEALRVFAGPHRLLPEQLWDGPDLPERELFAGRPTGSAMPLVWAHAEYLKLVASLRLGRVFDMPRDVAERYATGSVPSTVAIWAPNHEIGQLRKGRQLRLQFPGDTTVRWTTDGWETWRDTPTSPMLTAHTVTLPSQDLPAGAEIEFATRTNTGWEGTNHRLVVVDP